MPSRTRTVAPMSGKDFQKFLRDEINHRNSGLGSVNLNRLARLCGYSRRYLKVLLEGDDPNPSTKAQRCILFTLGYPVEGPEQDVVPHLTEKGVYDPKLHVLEASKRRAS